MIPVFIIAFNNFTYVRDMVNQLLKHTSNIYIIDNCSSFKPLLEYYEQIKDNINIVVMDQNYGHLVYKHPTIQALIPGDFYCITDPDLKFNKNLPVDFIEQLVTISKKHNAFKLGLALDITTDIRNDVLHFGKSIKEWESPSWIDKINDDSYELYFAGVDTTFCVINRAHLTQDVYIRVAGDFTAVHRPWLTYWKDELSTDELETYKKTSICSNWTN